MDLVASNEQETPIWNALYSFDEYRVGEAAQEGLSLLYKRLFENEDEFDTWYSYRFFFFFFEIYSLAKGSEFILSFSFFFHFLFFFVCLFIDCLIVFFFIFSFFLCVSSSIL